LPREKSDAPNKLSALCFGAAQPQGLPEALQRPERLDEVAKRFCELPLKERIVLGWRIPCLGFWNKVEVHQSIGDAML